MKILLGVIATHHSSRAEHIAAQRARLQVSGQPYKIVYGTPTSNNMPPRQPLDDELFFDVDDRRPWMVLKDKGLFQYALANGYDYVFRVCDDTIVHVDRLLAAGLAAYDYAGSFCGYAEATGYYFPIKYLDYMHGGAGVWLSRKAMQALVDDVWYGPASSPYPATVPVFPEFSLPNFHTYWDDLWMGEVLKGNLPFDSPLRNDPAEAYRKKGIKVFDDPSLFAIYLGTDSEKIIASHDPKQMGPTHTLIPSFGERVGKTIDWEFGAHLLGCKPMLSIGAGI